MPVSDSQPVSVGDLKEVMGEVEPRISDLEERPGGGRAVQQRRQHQRDGDAQGQHR